MIFAIDPGKDKCGFAVLNEKGEIMEKGIVSPHDLFVSLPFYLSKLPIFQVILGGGTFSKQIKDKLVQSGLRIEIIPVAESFSTLEARKRYWQEHRPRGIFRIIPTSLRVPPIPIDDYSAVIIGEKYLNSLKNSEQPIHKQNQ
jgi:RNase H-fold protein (predicted Holliday junction resolvase)